MEKQEPYSLYENVNQQSHHGDEYGGPQQTKNKTNYVSAPHLGATADNHTHCCCCTVHCSQHLGTAGCPPTDGSIKKMWLVYTMGLYSAIKGLKLYNLQHGYNYRSSCHAKSRLRKVTSVCFLPYAEYSLNMSTYIHRA